MKKFAVACLMLKADQSQVGKSTIRIGLYVLHAYSENEAKLFAIDRALLEFETFGVAGFVCQDVTSKYARKSLSWKDRERLQHARDKKGQRKKSKSLPGSRVRDFPE